MTDAVAKEIAFANDCVAYNKLYNDLMTSK